MKTNKLMKQQGKIVMATALAAGCLLWSSGNINAQVPANLSPGLQEVVKLTQAHMGDDIINAYIKNLGQGFALSADDILYLNSQGVSQGVISTLLAAKVPAGAPPPTPTYVPPALVPAYVPPPPAAPPAEAYVAPTPLPGSGIDLNYFQSQLAPYGNWVDVPPYGPVWRPNIAVADPGWRPYFNGGFWQYTETGWYWQSEFPYGDIVFHYGRWMMDIRYGWVWVPGYEWAPAWVSWRQTDAYAGWAPLPPYAVFEPGIGIMFRGRYGADVDFGLGYDDFVFVGYDHFWDHDYRLALAPVGVRVGLFRSSLVINNYSFGGDGRFVVEGIGHERIALLTHRDVRPVEIVIRDPRIVREREVQRTVVVRKVEEIRARPASDPTRRAMETHDAEVKEQRDHPLAAPVRGGAPDVRPQPGRGGAAPGRGTPERGGTPPARGGDPKDSKDNQGGPGGAPGR
jgi:hypothetical protein